MSTNGKITVNHSNGPVRFAQGPPGTITVIKTGVGRPTESYTLPRTDPTISNQGLSCRDLLQSLVDIMSKQIGPGVTYYWHFRKDFQKPYGLAFDHNVFDLANMKKQLRTMNYELANRLDYGISEFSSTIHHNFDYASTQETNKFIPEFLDRVSDIVEITRILDTKHKETTGDESKAIRDLKNFIKDDDKSFWRATEDIYKWCESLSSMCIWLQALRHIYLAPHDVFSKLHVETKCPEFRKRKTYDSYFKDVENLYCERRGRQISTDTPMKDGRKSLNDLLLEKKAKRAKRKLYPAKNGTVDVKSDTESASTDSSSSSESEDDSKLAEKRHGVIPPTHSVSQREVSDPLIEDGIDVQEVEVVTSSNKKKRKSKSKEPSVVSNKSNVEESGDIGESKDVEALSKKKKRRKSKAVTVEDEPAAVESSNDAINATDNKKKKRKSKN